MLVDSLKHFSVHGRFGSPLPHLFLFHPRPNWLLIIVKTLTASGVTLYGGPRASAELDIPQAGSFHHEYNAMACTIEIVDDVAAAISHIHSHGRYFFFSTFVQIRTAGDVRSFNGSCMENQSQTLLTVWKRGPNLTATFHAVPTLTA